MARKESEKGWEFFEHTADIGLRARGRDLRQLFEAAGNGLVALMFGRGKVRPRRSVELSATGEDAEELLVGWLEEILYAFEAERFAPSRVEVGRLEQGKVSGQLWGEDFDEQKHSVRQVVKAVTYHNLDVRRREGLYEADVIIDV